MIYSNVFELNVLQRMCYILVGHDCATGTRASVMYGVGQLTIISRPTLKVTKQNIVLYIKSILQTVESIFNILIIIFILRKKQTFQQFFYMDIVF